MTHCIFQSWDLAALIVFSSWFLSTIEISIKRSIFEFVVIDFELELVYFFVMWILILTESCFLLILNKHACRARFLITGIGFSIVLTRFFCVRVCSDLWFGLICAWVCVVSDLCYWLYYSSSWHFVKFWLDRSDFWCFERFSTWIFSFVIFQVL